MKDLIDALKNYTDLEDFKGPQDEPAFCLIQKSIAALEHLTTEYVEFKKEAALVADDNLKLYAHVAGLQQEVEALRGQVPRWISCDEKLPEVGQGADYVSVLARYQPRYLGPSSITNADYRRDGTWAFMDVAPTHWMPLPQALQAEEAKP